jgi:predicted nucleic acid-binding protein
VTGGTNEGVEALVHLHARKYGADVLGVISESTTGAIQPNTITHATFAGRGWYDVLPAQISLVEQSGGSMIFIGGGDIVKDAIQAAKNSNIEFALLNGVTGAADEKAVLYPDKAIRHASEALEKLVQIIDNYHARTAWNPPGSLPTSVTQVSVGNLIRGQDAQTTIGILRNSSLQYSYLLSLKNDPSGRPTVGQHSEAVMNQLLRYPFKELLKQDEIELLKVLIACHDLEKYPEHGNREDSPEHDRAEKWLRKFAPLFGLDDTRIEIAATLIQSKIIGKLMKDIAPARLNSDAKRSMSRLIMEQPEDTRNKKYQECIDELYLKAAESKVGQTEYHKMIDVACQAICNEANHCGLSSSDYLLLAMAFYQSDCSTYTADSRCESGNLRGDLSMEFLFELNSDSNFNTNEPMIDFDHTRGRMKMRGIFEFAIRDLEMAIGKVTLR